MAIHIDIYAHLRKNQLIKEGEELKRYVESLERDVNKRLDQSARRVALGPTSKLVKLNDQNAASLDRAVNATDAYILATERLTEAKNKLRNVNRWAERTEEQQDKKAKARAKAEAEVADAKLQQAFAAQQLSKATNDLTRNTEELRKETTEHGKNQRKVTKLVKETKKEFAQLTRTVNRQRRELEDLRSTHQGEIKDNRALVKQLERVTDATKKTTIERDKYNEMVKEGVATHKQLRDQAERARQAYITEQRVLRDTKQSISDVVEGREKHDVTVKANTDSLRKLSSAALDNRKQIESLRDANQDLIRDNAALTRSFDGISEATDKAFREHQKFNRMARDSSVSQDQLRQQAERVRDAYARQGRDVDYAREALRRHSEKEAELQRRKALTGKRHQDLDPIRSVARNLGALTPLGTVTPTLVLPLGTLFTQLANGVVAASQSIALLPAVLTAGGAAFGTITMATRGFSDTIGALVDGDLEKFAEEINKLSPNAQQAALALQSVLPELEEIQKSAQDAFFEGAPQLGLEIFEKLGPTVSRLTTSIAKSMNQSMKGVGQLLVSPEGMRSIESISDNIATMFREMEPAVTAVAQAFLTLTEEGGSLLPKVARDLAKVSGTFAEFLKDTQNSGSLKTFMEQGWEAIKAVGEALLNFGKMLYQVFGLKSQQDIDRFRETMQEMTDLIGVVLGTIKKLFEDIAGAFRILSDVAKSFGMEMGDISTVLARVAEAWLFVHGVKRLRDLTGAAKDFASAMAIRAGAMGIGGAGLSAAGGAAAAGAGGAGLLAAVGPLNAFVAALAAGAAAVWGLNKAIGAVVNSDFGQSITEPSPADYQRNFPSPPTRDPLVPHRVNPGLPVQGAGLPPNAGAPQDLGGLLGNPSSDISITSHNFYNDWYPTNDDDPFAVPDMPMDPAAWQSTPGTFELDKIPIGAFGGAEWDVPHGVFDIPRMLKPGDSGFGKPGAWNVDPWKVQQAQWQVEDAKVRAEESRKNYLKLAAEGTATQDDINRAAYDVIQAERSWMESMRSLKEAERGEFEAFDKQTKTFADDLREALGDMGAALDADFGISKGLAGIAENITKFVATLAAAPVLGAMKGYQAGLGFPGGKGVGSGLVGIAAAQMGYYEQDEDATAFFGGGYASQQAMWQQYGSNYGLSGSYGPGPGNFGDRVPYGLPPGTDTGGYGSSGKVFPPWVHAIEDIFGIKASTYKGHQESDRNEPGYAPNPNRENRGIDWTGPTENLQKFAEYLERIPQALEQVIWQNPNTGRKTGIGGGQINPGYYPQSTYDVHGGNDPSNIHVHTRQSASIPLPQGYGPQQQQQVPYGSPYYQVPQAYAYGPQPGVFDDGGVLPPGPSIVVNNTGKPEPLVPPVDPKATSVDPNTTVHGLGNAAPPGTPASPQLTPGGAPTPLGVPTQGTTIGSEVEPYAGYGSGFKVGGGILGSALNAAASAAGGAGGPGGAATAAALQIGIQEIQRAIEYGAEVAGITAQGIIDTVLPAGGSKLAQENWITRIAGGIIGAAPAIPNLAGNGGKLGQGANLPGVGPATPEQIAAQNMDPNRTQHTGTGPPPGPTNNTGVYIENYNTLDNRGASQDFGRYAIPGQR
ncbi:tape measure protein [Mycobacterium phage Ryadel]|uniref:Tape measure protein n=1 Tax=Mycobacterium phage Ryadel TaxID=2283292 RepID=A0A345MF27_9CAUD|nr:tail length tape measure protein [Mycobacterium phage Ryadel]AXH69158.1 tape measure protein [Mycobacterium phage Ryadel]